MFVAGKSRHPRGSRDAPGATEHDSGSAGSPADRRISAVRAQRIPRWLSRYRRFRGVRRGGTGDHRGRPPHRDQPTHGLRSVVARPATGRQPTACAWCSAGSSRSPPRSRNRRAPRSRSRTRRSRRSPRKEARRKIYPLPWGFPMATTGHSGRSVGPLAEHVDRAGPLALLSACRRLGCPGPRWLRDTPARVSANSRMVARETADVVAAPATPRRPRP